MYDGLLQTKAIVIMIGAPACCIQATAQLLLKWPVPARFACA